MDQKEPAKDSADCEFALLAIGNSCVGNSSVVKTNKICVLCYQYAPGFSREGQLFLVSDRYETNLSSAGHINAASAQAGRDPERDMLVQVEPNANRQGVSSACRWFNFVLVARREEALWPYCSACVRSARISSWISSRWSK